MLFNKTVEYPDNARRRWCVGWHTKQCMRMFDASVCVSITHNNSFNAPCLSPRTRSEKLHSSKRYSLILVLLTMVESDMSLQVDHFMPHTVWKHLNSSFSLIYSACSFNFSPMCTVSVCFLAEDQLCFCPFSFSSTHMWCVQSPSLSGLRATRIVTRNW